MGAKFCAQVQLPFHLCLPALQLQGTELKETTLQTAEENLTSAAGASSARYAAELVASGVAQELVAAAGASLAGHGIEEVCTSGADHGSWFMASVCGGGSVSST